MKKRILFLLIPLLLVSGCEGLLNRTGKQDDGEYVLLKVNNYAGLLKLYRDRLQKKEDPKNRYKVAEYYYLLEDFESSRHFLAPLLKSHPSGENYILESKNLLELGEREQALEAVDKAIALSPDNGDAYNMRGVILAELGYFDEAVSSFNKARARFLDDNIVMNNIAMVYILKEDYKQALSYIMPMYSRGDRSPKLVHNLILSLIKTHDYVAAEKVIRDENIPQSLEQLISALGDLQVAVKENKFEAKNSSKSATPVAVPVNSSEKTSATGASVLPPSEPAAKTDSGNGVLGVAVAQPAASNGLFGGSTSTPVENTASTTTQSSALLPEANITAKSVPDSLIVDNSTMPVASSSNVSSVSVAAAPLQNDNANPADRATISDVRMADNAKGSRLVIESDKEIKFTLIASDKPNQLIIELNNFNPSKLLSNTNGYLKTKHKTVESITFTPSGANKVKMVFQFKRKVNPKVYRMGPEDHYKDRVVIDIIG
jgi:tight adherence protein D